MAPRQWRLLIAATFLLLTHVAGAQVRAPRVPSTQVTADIESSIHDAAAFYCVDPALIRSVIQAESNFNPWAVSRAGAMGLMQLMPQTAWRLGVSNPFNPRQNVFAGTLYLKELLEEYKDSNLALAAYNAGDGNVHSYRGVPPFRETIEYINRIAYLYRCRRFNEIQQMSETIALNTLGDHRPTP